MTRSQLYRDLSAVLSAVSDTLARLAAPRRPGRPTLGPPEEFFIDMAKFFRYPIALPPLPESDQDVTVRELAVSIDGAATTVTGDHSASEVKVEAPEGAAVVITLTDVDDAGNRSEASDPLTFTATDTVPPSRPGALSAGAPEEFFKDDPAPTPTPPASDADATPAAGG